MQPYPHIYKVTANGTSTGLVSINSPNVPLLVSAPPAEFDGPGDQWSPETLLCATVADCFILTFRSVARAFKIEWSQLTCDVSGALERIEGESRFTRMNLQVMLIVPVGTEPTRCRQALDKAEHGCLIGNSLRAERILEADIKEI